MEPGLSKAMVWLQCFTKSVFKPEEPWTQQGNLKLECHSELSPGLGQGKPVLILLHGYSWAWEPLTVTHPWEKAWEWARDTEPVLHSLQHRCCGMDDS